MKGSRARNGIGLSRLQKAAYHEAAHVHAHFKVGVAFKAVYLAQNDGTITLSDGRVKTDALGTIEVCDPTEFWHWVDKENGDDFLSIPLSGPCASKIMTPHLSYETIINSGEAASDWLQARTFVRAITMVRRMKKYSKPSDQRIEIVQISDEVADCAIRIALRNVRRFVKAEWTSIVNIGNALLDSTPRSLTFDECAEILGKPQTLYAVTDKLRGVRDDCFMLNIPIAESPSAHGS